MKKIYLFLPFLIYMQIGIAQAFVESPQVFEGLSFGSISFQDLDGDADQDFLLTGVNNNDQPSTRLYINIGDGIYSEKIDTQIIDVYGGATAFTDVDGDLDKDLIISGAGFTGYYAKLYLNDGGGNFSEKPGTPFKGTFSGSIACFDADGDLDEDVLFTGETSTGVVITDLFLNDGAGNFSLSNTPQILPVTFGKIAAIDVDNDGDIDILLTGETQAQLRKTQLYFNNGSGIFTPSTNQPFIGVVAGAIGCADVDNDLDMDFLVAGLGNNAMNSTTLYENDGAGNFSKIDTEPFLPLWNGSINFSDIDQDNDQDALITGIKNADEGFTGLYYNDGDGHFSISTDVPFESVGASALAISDVDNDDDPDIFMIGKTFPGFRIAKLYLNQTNTLADKEPGSVWASSIQIFPNPVLGDDITITFASPRKVINCCLYNLCGRPIYKWTELSALEGNTISLLCPELPNGYYMLEIEDSGFKKLSKVLLIR